MIFFLSNFPIVVEEERISNNNWAWTRQAVKTSDMAQELANVNTLIQII